MDFGTRLKEEMEYQDIQYKDLAAKTNVAERALYTYVASKNPSMPPADVAVKIAQALNVSVEYLVTGSTSPDNSEKDIKQTEQLRLYKKYHTLIEKIDTLQEDSIKALENLAEYLK